MTASLPGSSGGLRWRIKTRDRVGMALDVLKLVSGAGIDIRAMEVAPRLIYLRLGVEEAEGLKDALLAHPDVQGVEPLDALPQEERERQLTAVLHSVGEGIIAVDRRGRVTTLNPRAEAILKLPADQALGRPLAELLPGEGLPISTTLQTGSGYDNQEIVLNTPRGRLHYLTTGRPIVDGQGNTIGVVAALKDMGEVRDLVYSVTQPPAVSFRALRYRSAAMARVVALAERVARGDSTVLIRGESGTGKELFARAIHGAGRREARPFVPINCAALPDALLESELFGYEEGAFTGARKGGKLGLFELAHQGTLFLDEIGELSPHLQAKLLRVLQEGRVRRVGGSDEVPVDVRIIAATNRDLEAMVERREFRADLYYRLNVVPLLIPPLRNRPEDIPVLAAHVLELLAHRLERPLRLSPEGLAVLERHHWPGNVRELENVLERAANLSASAELGPADLALLPGRQMGAPTATGTLPEQVAAFERELVRRAVAEQGSVRKAARALGVSHVTLLNKLKSQ